MNVKKLRYRICILVAAILAVACLPVSAAVSVKAQLDSASLLMGRTTLLKLTVDQPKGTKGRFPLFSELRENGIIPVCGDSVEYRMPVKYDTVENGGMETVSMQIPVQSFDSGFYRLPEFVYVTGRDSIRSNALALKVVPVPVKADTPINDYANVADPADASIFDRVPDWIVKWWWLVLIAVAAMAVAVWLFMKYRKEGTLMPRKPEPSPYETAITALSALKEKKLWEQGMEKEYFTELTDILRIYLYRRFGINAMEMTSRQILAGLSKNEELKDKRHYFRQILDMADFVKFAKVRPLPADNIASYDNAVKFVEETKPVPQPEETPSPAAPVRAKGKKMNKMRKGGVR